MTATGLIDALRDWHDFYVLIGTAAATLVGLMFVAASIGAAYFNVEREAGLRAFLTPTVLHFAAVLITCLVVIAPSHSNLSLGIALMAGSVLGLGYSLRVWVEIDREDQLWYLLAPITSYLLMAAAAIFAFASPASSIGLDFLAGSVVLLLVLGIRNAWDMTVWIAVRAPTPPDNPE
jgi:uncharacterized membrane protein